MAQNEITTGIGLRRVRVALRDLDGMITVPDAQVEGNGYEGLAIGGALAMTITIPDPQRVTARGDDRPYYTFQLPPTDTPSGELRVSKTSSPVIALLSRTKVFGDSPIRKIGFATDRQGDEQAVIVWGCRQAIDSDEESINFGQQVWQTYVLLNAMATVRPASMEDAAVGEVTYALAANDSAVDELGQAFTQIINGFTKAPYIMVVTKEKFTIDAFVAGVAQVVYTLSHASIWYEDGGVAISVDGTVLATDAYTCVAGVVTLDAAPTTGAKVIAEYQYT